MPDFNPANTKFRNGIEQLAPGVRAAILDGFHRIQSETMTPIFNGVPLNEIDGTGIDQGDILTTLGLGPAEVGMRLRGDKGTLRYLSRFLRASATPTTPAGATLAREHIWDQNQTDVLFDKTLTLQVSRDNGLVWSMQGVDIQQLVFDMQGGELCNMNATIMWQDITHFSEPVVVSDITPNADQPRLSGLLNQTNFDLGVPAAANSVHLQVDSIAGLPTSVDLLAKVGAGAFGANAFTVTIGNRSNGQPILVKVLDSTTQRPIGSCRLPAYVHVADGTDFEVAGTPDEWTFNQLVEWTPTLETKSFYNLACATISVDGLSEVLNSSTLTLTRGLRLPGDGSHIGPAIPLPLAESGDARYELTFAKDQLDTEIIEKILYGKTFAVLYELRTDVFIDAAQPYEEQIDLAFTGAVPTAGQGFKTSTDKEAREETITAVASGTPPLRATVTTTITDFTV